MIRRATCLLMICLIIEWPNLKQSLCSALERMTLAMVLTVGTLRKNSVRLTHSLRARRIARLDHQTKLIAQQAMRMASPAKLRKLTQPASASTTIAQSASGDHPNKQADATLEQTQCEQIDAFSNSSKKQRD